MPSTAFERNPREVVYEKKVLIWYSVRYLQMTNIPKATWAGNSTSEWWWRSETTTYNYTTAPWKNHTYRIHVWYIFTHSWLILYGTCNCILILAIDGFYGTIVTSPNLLSQLQFLTRAPERKFFQRHLAISVNVVVLQGVLYCRIPGWLLARYFFPASVHGFTNGGFEKTQDLI